VQQRDRSAWPMTSCISRAIRLRSWARARSANPACASCRATTSSCCRCASRQHTKVKTMPPIQAP
jgi:hypothetical protein